MRRVKGMPRADSILLALSAGLSAGCLSWCSRCRSMVSSSEPHYFRATKTLCVEYHGPVDSSSLIAQGAWPDDTMLDNAQEYADTKPD
jgi:hypothetical protein